MGIFNYPKYDSYWKCLDQFGTQAGAARIHNLPPSAPQPRLVAQLSFAHSQICAATLDYTVYTGA